MTSWEWVGRALFNAVPFVLLVLAAYFYGREKERSRTMREIVEALPRLPPDPGEVPYDRDDAWRSGPYYPTDEVRARLEAVYESARPKSCSTWPTAPDGLLAVYRAGQSDCLARLATRLDSYARGVLVAAEGDKLRGEPQ